MSGRPMLWNHRKGNGLFNRFARWTIRRKSAKVREYVDSLRQP